MLRSSAFSVFALAAVLSAGAAGCFAVTVPSREVDSPEDFARSMSWMVDPGTRDDGNVYLPVVRIETRLPYSMPGDPPGLCSGALIDRRVVLTAGHCVCPFPRSPYSELLPEKSKVPLRAGVQTRAQTLRDVSITGTIDSRSPCAQTSTVFTDVYGEPDAGSPLGKQYHGKVLVHPQIELIHGSTPKYPIRYWNNADLAVILLDEPVSLDFEPVTLADFEVNEGDAFIVVGYGPGGSSKDFGLRQFGENKVARRIIYATGNVLFSSVVAAGSKSSTAAFVRRGDSGGACLRKENPNVLIGVVSLGLETYSGTEVSFFTSIYPYREWLLDIIRGAHLPADAGSTPSVPPTSR